MTRAPRASRAHLWQLGAVELAALVRAGAVSSREAVQSCLARMDAVNPHLNAVGLPLAEEALAQADRADAAARRGDPLGPLHGVPVTTKVNTDQRGCPTDNGVPAYKALKAEADSPVVANLRRAGAIVVGRTNTPCYSMRWFTDNELHGRTLSPWNAGITPGGSSGGAAAAVASGIGPIAQGNDIAGSVRYPSYCCGLFGLRPSYGRVPAYNPTATAPPAIASQLMAVQGPLARTVADLRVAFEAMAVPDARDPRGVPIGAFPLPARPIRVAVVARPGGAPAHPAVAEAVGRAGRALAAAGYAVEETEPPGFKEAADLWQKLAMPDTIARLEPMVAASGDAGIRRSLGLWRAVFPERDPQACLDALGDRYRLLRLWQEFLERVPIVVAPVSLAPPFAVGTDVRDREATARLIAAQAPLLTVSVLGLPSIAAPTGLHDAVPIGVQVIAGPCREDLCFDAAAVLEAHFPMPTPIDPVLGGA